MMRPVARAALWVLDASKIIVPQTRATSMAKVTPFLSAAYRRATNLPQPKPKICPRWVASLPGANTGKPVASEWQWVPLIT
jgi:hypothetical protein